MALCQLTHLMYLSYDRDQAQHNRYMTLLTGLLHLGEFNMRE